MKCVDMVENWQGKNVQINERPSLFGEVGAGLALNGARLARDPVCPRCCRPARLRRGLGEVMGIAPRWLRPLAPTAASAVRPAPGGVCTRRGVLRPWRQQSPEPDLKGWRRRLGSLYSHRDRGRLSRSETILAVGASSLEPGRSGEGQGLEMGVKHFKCFLVNSGFIRTTEQAPHRFPGASDAWTSPGAAARPLLPAPGRLWAARIHMIPAFPSGSLIPQSASVLQRKHKNESHLINLPLSRRISLH